MDDMTLIVLAGGEGKRFWPFTTSKALFPFFGVPVLTHILSDLPKEISRLIIVTSPVNDEYIRSLPFSVPASTVIQKTPNGMADAMLACREVVGNSSVIIMNSDDIVSPALLESVIATAITSDVFGVIPGLKTLKHGPFGYLAFDGNRVKGIVEKPAAGREPSQYAYLVCDYIRNGKEFMEELVKTKSTQDDVFEKALTGLMTKYEFAFVPDTGPFAPLKLPRHVLPAMDVLFTGLEKHKGKNVRIKSNVVIEGPVYIEDNVQIFENTKIVGPCYIGKNTIIGNNCIIRDSHIGADSVIGFNCDITRSYLGDNCWLHMNYVGDSVLEGNVSMGGGAKLANLRLDDGEIMGTGRTKLGVMIGRGVRIGVNASIMPGVKIGANSFIGSGVILDKDIPENSFCAMKTELRITKNRTVAPTSREEFKKKL